MWITPLRLWIPWGEAVNCPYCRHPDSRVLDSRTSEEGSAVRRRRECPRCGRRFTTYERPAEVSLRVTKKDGRREPFDRAKLLGGLRKACEKRPISGEQIEALVDDIERVLRDTLADEVSSADIGTMVMERLRALDEVAYVRFASVYKEFRDADSFRRELDALPQRAEPSRDQQPLPIDETGNSRGQSSVVSDQ